MASNNFAEDPKKASEAGKKGGENIHRGQQSQQSSDRSQSGSPGNQRGDYETSPMTVSALLKRAKGGGQS